MNTLPSRHKRYPTVNLTPLEATLTRFAVTIANKGLMEILIPLDATLTKYQGGAVDTDRCPTCLVRAQHGAPHHSRVTYP